MHLFYLVSIILSFLMTDGPKNPEELGKVHWIRNYNQALTLSKELNKAVFILFQEVPGCLTCKNYGNNILSHPFIVEAIEDEFVPLVIYNNEKGEDAKILQRYKEPSWNNPVVRIVDARGENIVDRLAGNYSLSGITNTIIDALLASNKIAPDYLHLFAEELETNSGPLKESFLSMYCFWTGEKEIGDIKGVAEIEAGFMGGKEVVKVKYNPNLVSYSEILKKASRTDCADSVFTDDKREKESAKETLKIDPQAVQHYKRDRTPKYYLSNSIFQYVPMSKMQSARINTALGRSQSALELLSPRQQKLLEYIQANRKQSWENVCLKDFNLSWWTIYPKIALKT
jgi:hypothetical protein